MRLKPIVRLAVASLLVCATNYQISSLRAQGSLTPPAAPGPTMVTLQQIEPRTPISAPGTIAAGGSYYLTTNLTVSSGTAIIITASEVTLDLNGFAITGTGTAATGIDLMTAQDITLLNGHINGGYVYSAGSYTGSGFSNGITYEGTGNVRISGVTVSGVYSNGIGLGTGNSSLVESCVVNTAGGYGIVAGVISHSTATPCGYTAIDALMAASDCCGICTGGGNGVTANSAMNCIGQSSTGYGLLATLTATGCTGISTNGTGLSANTAENCIGSCKTTSSAVGLSAGIATGCTGTNLSNGPGLQAQIATGCRGLSVVGVGLTATYTAENCYGASQQAAALQAQIATGCSGIGFAGTGVSASVNAVNCYGYNHDLNTYGVSAYTATGCVGSNAYGNVGLTATYANFCFGTPTIVVSSNEYNMS
jgi:hypothetical protein